MTSESISEKRIALLRELKELSANEEAKKISSPQEVLPFLSKWFKKEQEFFIVACLDGAHRIQTVKAISQGTLNRTVVHPREVFREAVKRNSAAIIVAHNHPSGCVDPSPEDREVTHRLKNAGDLMGIPVLDHLIFSHGGKFLSLRDQGAF